MCSSLMFFVCVCVCVCVVYSTCHVSLRISGNYLTANAVTIDPVTVKIANWLLIRQPEQ